MVDYCLINHTDTAVSNVNAGGIDVPKRSIRVDITLDATELAAAVASGLTVLTDNPSRAKLRALAKVCQYRIRTTAGAAL